MRFIDADKCPCKHCKRCNYVHVMYCASFERWINKTVYDVDKVVAELEKYQELCFSTMANTQDTQLDIVYEYVSSVIEEAIEIVKRGGINV